MSRSWERGKGQGYREAVWFARRSSERSLRACWRFGSRSGGETGIRTLDRVSPIHAFQACAFNHSAISPVRWDARKRARQVYQLESDQRRPPPPPACMPPPPPPEDTPPPPEDTRPPLPLLKPPPPLEPLPRLALAMAPPT